MIQRTAVRVLMVGVLAGFAAPAGLTAQAVPAIGGIELRAGVAAPEGANAGLAAMAEVDLGYAWRPQLRVIAGLGRFTANIDREFGDDEGSFSATGAWLGARYDLFTQRRTGAYVRAALTVHSVQADAWDRDVDDLLSGTTTGAALAVGARRALDSRGRVHAVAEVRRTLMNNLGNTTIEIGLRLLRRGWSAWQPDASRIAAAPIDGADRNPPLGTPTTPVARQVADTAADRRAAEDRRVRMNAAAAERADQAAAERTARAAAARADAEARTDAAARADAGRMARLERAAANEALLRQGLARAAAVMQSVTGMQETDSGFLLTMAGGAFASGASELSRSARSEVRILATVLAGYPGYIVVVDGHSDAVGDSAANQRLSLERAAAVRAALIVEGVDPLWTAARGFGATRPIASNDTQAGRATNRRVEVRIARTMCADPPLPAADGGLRCTTPTPSRQP